MCKNVVFNLGLKKIRKMITLIFLSREMNEHVPVGIALKYLFFEKMYRHNFPVILPLKD